MSELKLRPVKTSIQSRLLRAAGSIIRQQKYERIQSSVEIQGDAGAIVHDRIGASYTQFRVGVRRTQADDSGPCCFSGAHSRSGILDYDAIAGGEP
jgi:hypothetical protein